MSLSNTDLTQKPENEDNPMPDCSSPKCHEHMTVELKNKVGWKEYDGFKTKITNECAKVRKCLDGKLTKKFVGTIAALVGIPLITVGAGIWAETKHLDKFVTQDEISAHIADIRECKTVTEAMQETLKDIKDGQKENSKDIKEILRHLRDKNNDSR